MWLYPTAHPYQQTSITPLYADFVASGVAPQADHFGIRNIAFYAE